MNLEGNREISSDTEHFDTDAMAAIGEKSGLDFWLDQYSDLLQPPPLPPVDSPDEFNMTPERDRTKQSIRDHEGWRNKPYRDPPGSDSWSVGIGHHLGKNLSEAEQNRVYSDAEIEQFFDEDFESHAAPTRDIPGFENLDPVQQGALEELSFNMGPAWYKNFPDMMKALERGDTATATEELMFGPGGAAGGRHSRWRGQVGENRSSDIANRLQFGQGDQAPTFAGGVAPAAPPPLDAGAGGGVNIVISNDDHSVLNSSENVSVIARAPDPQDQDRIEAV